MTKNIRKAAPEGAEYFRIAGEYIEYAKIGANGKLCVWSSKRSEWTEHSITNIPNALKAFGFHAFEAPKWIWFALGGLFCVVIVGLFLWL